MNKGYQCWEKNGKVYYKRYGAIYQVKKAVAVFSEDDPLGIANDNYKE